MIKMNKKHKIKKLVCNHIHDVDLERMQLRATQIETE